MKKLVSFFLLIVLFGCFVLATSSACNKGEGQDGTNGKAEESKSDSTSNEDAEKKDEEK